MSARLRSTTTYDILKKERKYLHIINYRGTWWGNHFCCARTMWPQVEKCSKFLCHYSNQSKITGVRMNYHKRYTPNDGAMCKKSYGTIFHEFFKNREFFHQWTCLFGPFSLFLASALTEDNIFFTLNFILTHKSVAMSCNHFKSISEKYIRNN